LLVREMGAYAQQPALAGRPLNFVYFAAHAVVSVTQQLQSLVKRLTAVSRTGAEEITFECEPGTLTDAKLAAIRRMGITRLSLGVENSTIASSSFNGRAHRSPEIGQAYRAARCARLPQINIDLIAGMLGETERTGARASRKHWSSSRQRHRLPDGAALQHDDSKDC